FISPNEHPSTLRHALRGKRRTRLRYQRGSATGDRRRSAVMTVIGNSTRMANGAFCCRYTGHTKGGDYAMWREQFVRMWLSADFESVGDGRVANEISGTHHSFLALCSMRGTPIRMDRRDDLDTETRNSLYLIIASNCRLQASQHGRSVDLSKGQMVLLTAGEPARLT